MSSPEELAVVGESHSFPLWIHFPLQYSTQRSLAGTLYIPLISCVNLSSVGGDTRIRISYQEEEIELKLPFGSHTRLFLSEVNRAWSGTSENKSMLLWWTYIDLYKDQMHPVLFPNDHLFNSACTTVAWKRIWYIPLWDSTTDLFLSIGGKKTSPASLNLPWGETEWQNTVVTSYAL